MIRAVREYSSSWISLWLCFISHIALSLSHRAANSARRHSLLCSPVFKGKRPVQQPDVLMSFLVGSHVILGWNIKSCFKKISTFSKIKPCLWGKWVTSKILTIKEAASKWDVSDHMQTRRSVLVCMSLHASCLSSYRTKIKPKYFPVIIYSFDSLDPKKLKTI